MLESAGVTSPSGVTSAFATAIPLPMTFWGRLQSAAWTWAIRGVMHVEAWPQVKAL